MNFNKYGTSRKSDNSLPPRRSNSIAPAHLRQTVDPFQKSTKIPRDLPLSTPIHPPPIQPPPIGRVDPDFYDMIGKPATLPAAHAQLAHQAAMCPRGTGSYTKLMGPIRSDEHMAYNVITRLVWPKFTARLNLKEHPTGDTALYTLGNGTETYTPEAIHRLYNAEISECMQLAALDSAAWLEATGDTDVEAFTSAYQTPTSPITSLSAASMPSSAPLLQPASGILQPHGEVIIDGAQPDDDAGAIVNEPPTRGSAGGD
eukprot:GHVP01070242.1.p1 GENE.GHVP01070242.1~~GHVP01070242.1.p1  ORF type:complete len:258 (+),score=18.46 GHVP01070242.1:38-811(+)